MLYSQFKNRCQVLTIDAREKMIKFGRYWKFPFLFSGKNPSVLFLLGKEGMEIIFFAFLQLFIDIKHTGFLRKSEKYIVNLLKRL